MNPKKTDRRRFLKTGAALAGLAVGASATASSVVAADVPSATVDVDELHKHGQRSHYVDSIRRGSINNPERHLPDEPRNFGLATPLQDSAGMLTPASLHYIVSHGYEPPDINPQEHRLLIHGMVDRPLEFSLDDLQRLPSVSRFHFIECHGNSTTAGPGGAARISPDATAQDTHGFTSCSQWTGVPLSLLLKEAGVQTGATWIIAEGADANKHSKSIPIEKA
jgi:sulfane dehydrogenase subunit SoxC